MENLSSIQEDLVFGLDIGTRNIVGVVGYQERNTFHVVAMAEQEHETRAMLDGQIHDIYKVGDTIRKVRNELEKQLGFQLTDVCIAAAGRVLRTVNAHAEYTFEEETRVNQEHIYSLNLLAVEKAHTEINQNAEKIRFYCVGYTPVTYKLNSFEINNLEGHKANEIAVDLIATFLPDEVVDGLYEAVEYAGLQVASLTLEPIAAMNIAIPEQYRLLNIGLIDVGAGTSDICLTKDGSIIAYGMIPFAGDEITELLAKTYLVDFNTADRIKVEANDPERTSVTFEDIMGLPMDLPVEEIHKVADTVVDRMAKETSDKIIELNGGKPVNAVFVVGGGGKVTGYTDKVASYLGIPSQRVAVRGEAVLSSVDFGVPNFKKDSLYVTPIGICTNYYTQKNNFVFVTVNNDRIKLYDNNKLTVVDAVMQVGFPNEKLFPRRGTPLNFTINGRSRMVRGTSGEGADVKLNGKPTNLNAAIVQNDVIQIKESTAGAPAQMTIGQLDEYKATIEFIVNDKHVLCPKFAYVNGELKSEFYEIQENDVIQMESYYTVSQLFEFLDCPVNKSQIYVNNELANADTKVYENFTIRTAAINEQRPEKIHEEFDEFTAISQENEDISDSDHYNTTADDVANENVAYDNAANNNTVGNNAADKNLSSHADKDNTENVSEEVNADHSDSRETTSAHSGDSNVKSELHDIVILINKEPVRLTGKKDYILVDLFQYYDFDLSKPKGSIVLKLNGRETEYTAPLKDGDMVDLYWEALK